MSSSKTDTGAEGVIRQEHGYGRRDGCPCCDASAPANGTRVFSWPRAEDIPFSRHGAFLSGYTPKRVFFTYVRCEQCGTYYCPVYYSPAQLQSLYERQPENMADVPLGSRARTQNGYLDILRRHSRMRGALLEIGADKGLFAEDCARAGQFERFWLCEPNRMMHPELAQRFVGRNATILTAMSPGADVPPRAVSTAAMIHVLDHVVQPRAMLREVFASLEPGGVLMMVTHNVRSVLARLLGRRWPPFTLQHPQLFAPEAIRVLLQSTGFELLELTRTTNYFPAAFLARGGLTVFGLPAKWIPQQGGPEIGVQLGNVCAIARRPRDPIV